MALGVDTNLSPSEARSRENAPPSAVDAQTEEAAAQRAEAELAEVTLQPRISAMAQRLRSGPDPDRLSRPRTDKTQVGWSHASGRMPLGGVGQQTRCRPQVASAPSCAVQLLARGAPLLVCSQPQLKSLGHALEASTR